MFAQVYFVIDKQTAKVPVEYIKKFEKSYNPQATYKVFWSRYIHSIQNENDQASLQKLNSLREPPAKENWKVNEGEGYYAAFILRVEDSLEELNNSLKRKRPTLPFNTQCDEDFISTTEDEASVQVQRASKKKEIEMKKNEQAAKRKKSEEIFKAAKRFNNKKFQNLGCGNETDRESDSDEDPEVIPKRKFDELKSAYNFLEEEKEKTDEKLTCLEKKLHEMKDEYEAMKLICAEVTHLRELNRQLQEKLLEGVCIHAANIQPEVNPEAGDTGTTEVELGAGISIDRKVYKEISDLDTVRKFTKSLAVAIWGSEVLAGRSVKGRPCRNRSGPKKSVPDKESVATPKPLNHPKPPLTPEKLSVITGQMREFLIRKGCTMPDIELQLKQRNKYISDKIQDICSNMARAEARNKSEEMNV